MITINISLIQPVLDMITQRPLTKKDRQEGIEEDLFGIIVKFFEKLEQPVQEEEIKVIWMVCQRTRNVPGFDITVSFPVRMPGVKPSFGDGFKVTQMQKSALQRLLMAYLKQTELLPEITVGVTICSLISVQTASAYRRLCVKKKK